MSTWRAFALLPVAIVGAAIWLLGSLAAFGLVVIWTVR